MISDALFSGTPKPGLLLAFLNETSVHSFISTTLFRPLEFYLIGTLCRGGLIILYKFLSLIGNNWLLFPLEVNFYTKSALFFCA